MGKTKTKYKFKYTTSIKKIRKMKSRIKVIQGGTSAGKTFAILPILITKATRKPGLRISVVSESYPHLRKGAIRDFLTIMKDTNRFIQKNWNITNSIYTFSNGSYIEFFSADNADSLRGSRRDILFVNECNNITYEAYNQLVVRTEGNAIYLDYNPSHEFWIDDVLQEGQAEKIILTYKDNEALNKNTLKYLESKRLKAETSEYWANWCKVYLDGQQGMLEGVVFNNWKQIDIIPKEATLIAYGLDWGYTNDPSTLIGVYKCDNNIYLKEFFYETNMTNQDIIRRLKDLGIGREEIYCDSAEPKSIREVQLGGFRTLPTTKGADSILFGIQLMQDYNIFITKDSKNLIMEFGKYKWKNNKTGQTLNTPIDNFNHGIDAVRYVFLSKLSNKNKMDGRYIRL